MRQWLKELRNKSNNLTQEQLAKAVGISRTMITEIENGNANPSVEVAKKIAAVLGFDWTLFYQDEDDLTKTGTG
ncbi:helix-turn-helix transcriptional regulator [Candidatus Saccharibacteria bacterium]|jgi:DNA-binding XRE family transcriptional regulator|nr:helix-turn-helix transcriptional regulator [Candidatus Saccharibacteria bacterium]